MRAISKALVAGWTVSAAIWFPPVAAADTGAIRPGDDTMTCEQIAAELVPYMQQVMPNIQTFGTSTQQLNAQSREIDAKRQPERQAVEAMATAGALDPTGASKRAYAAAVMAQQAKEHAENEALANSDLAKQNRAQGEQVAAQASQMKSDERLQHLMQLGQQKHCDKK